MMDHVQVVRALRNLDAAPDTSNHFHALCEQWKKLCAEKQLQQAIFETAAVAKSIGNASIGDRLTIQSAGNPPVYTVCGIDGSQIYPDRHEQILFILINVGGAFFSYAEKSTVKLFSAPHVYHAHAIAAEHSEDYASASLINQLRGERELEAGISWGSMQPGTLVLFDGSLLWLHLAAGQESKKRYLERLYSLFEELHRKEILHAGYVSLPQSRELIQLVSQVPGMDKSMLHHFSDSELMQTHLQPGEMTPFFTPRPTNTPYPPHLRPCFCYLHTGTEIGRLELPFWIAQNKELSNHLATLILDQCNKGNGYPRCLAEAHEQAVIREADRLFFNHLATQFSNTNNTHSALSRKAQAKRERAI